MLFIKKIKIRPQVLLLSILGLFILNTIIYFTNIKSDKPIITIITIVLPIIIICISVHLYRFLSKDYFIPLRSLLSYMKSYEYRKSLKPLPPELSKNNDFGLLSELMINCLDNRDKNEEKATDNSMSVFLQNLKDVSIMMEELHKNIDSIASTSEELSATMEETSALSTDIAGTSLEIAGTVQDFTEKADQGYKTSQEIKHSAEETMDNVSNAQEKAQLIFSDTKIHLEKAIDDAKIADQISILSKSINEIITQTNLLALNASIEAARAGEYGKGFSVVAEEIRKLAEQSKNNIAQIDEVTERVKEVVNNLAKYGSMLLQFMSEDVNSDYNFMKDVANKYKEDSLTINNLFLDFSTSSNELLNSISGLLTNLDHIVVASSEGAEGVNDIAMHISDMTSSSNEILTKLQDQLK